MVKRFRKIYKYLAIIWFLDLVLVLGDSLYMDTSVNSTPLGNLDGLGGLGGLGGLDAYSIYPRLIPSVGTEFLDPRDLDILSEVSSKCAGLSGVANVDLRARDYIISPRVYSLPTGGYLVDETACDYSLEVQTQLLLRWASLGVSRIFLGIMKAAQASVSPRLFFEPGSMYPDRYLPPKIGKIGKGSLSRKEVESLLKSLKLVHAEYWPVEMLANVLEPYAKKTRNRNRNRNRKGNKKGKGSRKNL